MSGHVLVLNAGSSSLKYALVDGASDRPVDPAGAGLVERIGERGETHGGRHRHRGPAGVHEAEREIGSHEDALRLALGALEDQGPSLSSVSLAAVGHRVVHGGDRFSAPALVDDDLVRVVESLVPLAPLHNPANLEGIAVARRLFADLPHVAVFDTAFHHTLPEHVATYAVPHEWTRDLHVRRYGFHGTSVSFVSREAARLLGRPVEQCRLVVLHLGNGASATAVDAGRSVETSMGFTPLEGLVMGTRSGDLDPAVPAYLVREHGWSLPDVDRALNRSSGLEGLVGDNDVRELVRLRAGGDEAARLAFDVYVHRIRKYVGAYLAVLGGADAVVFTGGVGENSADIRAAALAGLQRFGIEVDPALNDAPVSGARDIAAAGAPTRVLVVPTNEEWEIARQTLALLGGRAASS